MNLIGYVKLAQEKLFKPAPPLTALLVAPMIAGAAAPVGPPGSRRDVETPHAAAGETIEKFIHAQSHSVEGLSVSYNASTKTIVVRGTVLDRATREKIILSCHRVIGISRIDSRLTIAAPQSLESNYRAARPGMSPAKIAKTEFRSASSKRGDIRAVATA